MGILQLPTPLAAQSGLLPSTRKMVTTDSLATLTTAGYLNAVNLEGFPLGNGDIIEAFYAYNTTTKVGSFGIFTVSVSNGVITLAAWSNPGNVTTPVVSGDVATFSGTTGTIADSGILGTNIVTKNSVNVMATGSGITLFKGTGTGNTVTINQSAGTITTAALTTAGGASQAIVLTNSLITATSQVQVGWQGGTNTVANFSLQTVPAAGSATITIFNNTAATPLNGTIILGFTVD